jgi:phenylalanyl-tRNA synthetase alpha chain
MIVYKQITTTSFALTEEGLDIAAKGSHEYRVWEALPAKGGVALSMPDLKVSYPHDLLGMITADLG